MSDSKYFIFQDGRFTVCVTSVDEAKKMFGFDHCISFTQGVESFLEQLLSHPVMKEGSDESVVLYHPLVNKEIQMKDTEHRSLHCFVRFSNHSLKEFEKFYKSYKKLQHCFDKRDKILFVVESQNDLPLLYYIIARNSMTYTYLPIDEAINNAIEKFFSIGVVYELTPEKIKELKVMYNHITKGKL